MRKTIAILLLLLFTTQTEWGQLLRLPFALQHYRTHRQQEGSLSLLQFLREHYTPHHQDGDMAADSQLPFKSYNSEALSLIYIPAASPEAVLPPLPTSQNAFTHFNGIGPCRRSFAIFHPPQAV